MRHELDEDRGNEIAQTKRQWFAAVLSLFKERKIPGYKYQFATDRAIKGSRDNDTPVQSQVERKYLLGMKASQLMRAAPGDPRRGVLPVELVSSQPFGDFPIFIVKVVDMKAGVSRTNRLIGLKMVAGHKHENILKNNQKAMFLCSADTYLLFR